MSTKLIDISYWQGNIDFAVIKKAGYNHVIIRAGYGTTTDPNFYTYAKSCALNGIKIGVYWFCYSTTLAEVRKEVAKCIETIKNYNIDLPIFFDFEYDTITKAKNKGVTLGKNECSKFTIEFCEAIKKSGYTPGYYANMDFYKNYYSDEVKNKGYALWIAHYNSSQTMHTPPISCDFFQYSESGKVSGINGSTVDLDVCYTEKYLDCRNLKNTTSTATPNAPLASEIIKNVINDAVEFAVNIAKDNTHGYSQKIRSLYNIDTPKSFDCSSLVCTAFYYAFIKNGLTKQATYLKANCSYTGNMMKMLNCGFEVVATNQTAHAQMQKGDIELNINYHVALAIDKDNIVHARSSEGTSDTIDNSGNEIRTQSWYLYSKGWDKRLRFTGKGIDFSGITSNGSTNTSSKPSAPDTSAGNQLIKNAQIHLNNFVGANLQVDGIAGSATKKALCKALQLALNKDLDCNLHLDGIIGANTKGIMRCVNLKKGDRGHLVTFVEISMLLNNIDPKGVECPGSFGSGLESAVKCYQAKKELVQDSIVGYNTLMALCS